MAPASTDHLTVRLGPAVEALGLDLDAVELSTAGRRRVLRVVVDREGGVSLDGIAEATRAVSRSLDVDNPLGEQPYTLEVTSRGVDRPLTLPRHWARNAGRLVHLQTADGLSLTGGITVADDTGVELDADGDSRRVDYADVTSARVQVEFARKVG